jgi:uncharacterized membrane protein YphA (DoxX/SURF4 family)
VDGTDAASSWRVVRVIAGLQFAVAGVFSTLNWHGTVSFNATLVGDDASPVATGVGVALSVVGGLCVASGYRSAIGAVLVLVFLVPATVRHLLVVASIDASRPLGELAERGQLSSAAKNLVLIAMLVTIARTSPNAADRSP